MNYAQDALWHHLKNPTVRALASLLTAPAWWRSGMEISVRELLGERGFRDLLALDARSETLPRIAPQDVSHYAAELLAFWFERATHSTLLAHDFADNGNAYFIVCLSGSLYHIEAVCAYERLPEETRDFVPSQIPCRLVENMWRTHHISAPNIIARTLIRGTMFTETGDSPNLADYPQNAWTGIHITRPEQWQLFDSQSRFYPLSPTEYFAPARVPYEKTDDIHHAMRQNSGLIAHVCPRADGYWHEQQRLLVSR